MKGYNIILYTVNASIYVSLYFRLFAASNIFADLNFHKIFVSSKPIFEYFDSSPSLNFRLLKPLAKIAKMKAKRKNHTFTVYKSSHYSDHRHKNIIIYK